MSLLQYYLHIAVNPTQGRAQMEVSHRQGEAGQGQFEWSSDTSSYT
jgi:hypothetical protein